jgi:hypothetical protein
MVGDATTPCTPLRPLPPLTSAQCTASALAHSQPPACPRTLDAGGRRQDGQRDNQQHGATPCVWCRLPATRSHGGSHLSVWDRGGSKQVRACIHSARWRRGDVCSRRRRPTSAGARRAAHTRAPGGAIQLSPCASVVRAHQCPAAAPPQTRRSLGSWRGVLVLARAPARRAERGSQAIQPPTAATPRAQSRLPPKLPGTEWHRKRPSPMNAGAARSMLRFPGLSRLKEHGWCGAPDGISQHRTKGTQGPVR